MGANRDAFNPNIVDRLKRAKTYPMKVWTKHYVTANDDPKERPREACNLSNISVDIKCTTGSIKSK